MYSTDNGPHYNTWPDAGTTPFRGEKNSNWEGAYRVPAFVRWPGQFPAGTTLNGIVSHEDWLPTFAAIAGAPDIKEKLAKGVDLNGRRYRNHIDGYNLLDYLTGTAKQSPRNEFWYVNDDAEIVAAKRPGLESGLPREPRRGLRRLARTVRGVRASRCCSTCGAIRSKRPSTTPTPTTTGSWIARSSSCRSRRWRRGSSRPWSTTRRARRPARST